jgi:hypothetical protein
MPARRMFSPLTRALPPRRAGREQVTLSRSRALLTRLFPVALLGLGVAVTGCASKTSARLQEQKAYEEGKQSILREQTQQNEPVVFFRGDVRNQRVPWREGLTLAEALLAAQYTWAWDPRVITVTRNGQTHSINPKALLRGGDNPLLEPGDAVEVRH